MVERNWRAGLFDHQDEYVAVEISRSEDGGFSGELIGWGDIPDEVMALLQTRLREYPERAYFMYKQREEGKSGRHGTAIGGSFSLLEEIIMGGFDEKNKLLPEES